MPTRNRILFVCHFADMQFGAVNLQDLKTTFVSKKLSRQNQLSESERFSKWVEEQKCDGFASWDLHCFSEFFKGLDFKTWHWLTSVDEAKWVSLDQLSRTLLGLFGDKSHRSIFMFTHGGGMH